MVNAVGGVVADTCGDGFILSAPRLSLGPKAALYDKALAATGIAGDCLSVMSYIQLATPQQELDTTVISIFDAKRTDSLLRAVGV